MGRRLKDVLQSLPEGRRQRIMSRGQELVAEMLALRQLRQRLSVSQREMAERLEVSQPAISQLEQQRDIQLSTLRNYVAALGGSWRLLCGYRGSCRSCYSRRRSWRSHLRNRRLCSPTTPWV
jgi:transcriptional regulator with XRE-family HTH domain